jgi:OOP family OmpA-OmpF porin
MRFLPGFVLLFSVFSLYGQKISNESFQQINSSFDELNPVLSADGRTLFFTIANHPDNMGNKRDPGDIWFSHWDGTGWSAPVHGGNVINDRAYNAVAGISQDGQYLYLLSHYGASGNTARTQGISIAKHSGNGWDTPVNIVIPYFQNKSNRIGGAISADQHVFVFAAETYGTHGVEDLYVTVSENGNWSEPLNLGSVINTKSQELCPSLSDDGKTLYFSSNRSKGHGSFDVYSSSRLDDSWASWSEPINLGSINSDGRELYYRDFPQWGFSLFTSTKNSDGYGDMKVYRYDDSPLVQKDSVSAVVSADTIPGVVEIAEVRNTNPNVVRLHGKVVSSKSGEVVNAQMTFAGPEMQEPMVLTAGSSGYVAEVLSLKQYAIKIEAPGYVSTLERLDLRTGDMPELEMNFNLQPIEIGTTVNLKNVLFQQTKTEILPESYDELDLVVSFLKANPHVKIELLGHTDNRGVHADNVRLSQNRVNAVKNYLVSKGIDSKRITGKGYGGTKPIASNESEETRKMNRRVEFVIRKF